MTTVSLEARFGDNFKYQIAGAWLARPDAGKECEKIFKDILSAGAISVNIDNQLGRVSFYSSEEALLDEAREILFEFLYTQLRRELIGNINFAKRQDNDDFAEYCMSRRLARNPGKKWKDVFSCYSDIEDFDVTAYMPNSYVPHMRGYHMPNGEIIIKLSKRAAYYIFGGVLSRLHMLECEGKIQEISCKI